MKDQKEMENEHIKVLLDFRVVRKIQMMIALERVWKKDQKLKRKKMEIWEELLEPKNRKNKRDINNYL